jgi:hypothetical protein
VTGATVVEGVGPVTVGHAELVALFGAEHVVRVAEGSVAGLGLGGVAARVLTEVGLPTGPARGLPADSVSLFAATPPVPDGDSLVRVGRLFEDAADVGAGGVEANTAVVDRRTGAVVGRFGAGAEIFVSSDLALFVETLYRVNRLAVEHADDVGDELAAAAAALEDDLRTLDPPAFAHDAWWPSVLEELQYG